MMAFLFIILAAMALAHFVYDGIIAPSRRMALRYDIFAQRDLIRDLNAEYLSDEDQKVLDSLHDSVNTAVCLLSTISVSMLLKSSLAWKNNPNLRAKIEARRRLLERSHISEVQEVRMATDDAVKTALVVNSFGLFLWLLPIAIFHICLSRCVEAIERVLLSPSRELHKMFPPTQFAVG